MANVEHFRMNGKREHLSKGTEVIKKKLNGWEWCHLPVIAAHQEAMAGGSKVQG